MGEASSIHRRYVSAREKRVVSILISRERPLRYFVPRPGTFTIFRRICKMVCKSAIFAFLSFSFSERVKVQSVAYIRSKAVTDGLKYYWIFYVCLRHLSIFFIYSDHICVLEPLK